MKQDEGRGIVIMDKTKYPEKSLALLNTNQFVKLNSNPTKQIETKIQRKLRKIKTVISLQEYQTFISDRIFFRSILFCVCEDTQVITNR